MVYAYLIEDVRALADLFKVNQTPKESAHGLFTAYRVRHPEYKARQALILLGVSSNSLKAPLPENVGREIHVSSENGELFLYNDKRKEQLEIFGFESAPRLEELIEPTQVHHGQEEDHDVSVVFWLKDKSLMPEIVRRSLYLNNDRISLASFTHEGEEVTLIRIESPSYYLLTWCQEQDPERQTLFVPMTDGPGLYVQWGYRHPLAELWRRSFSEHQDRWIFFPANAHFQVTQKPEWRSIYELTDFSINIDDVDAWEQLSHGEDRFQVSLNLAPRHEPAPVEVLLLREDDRDRLEDYFSMADDADIERLELSAVRDDEGKQWYFLREKHRGSDGTLLMHVGGVPFARYKGFDNLFLPNNLVLEPQLRRDQYKKLFELRPAVLSFVVPDYDAATGRHGSSVEDAKHVRVLKSSFEPLKNFVDYVVHFEREALEDILQDSIFDLGVYKDAPSRAGMTESKTKRKKVEKAEPKENANAKNKGDRMQQRIDRAKKQRARRLELQARQVDEVKAEDATAKVADTPSELELLEADLERDLVRHGPQVELWQDLGVVKHRRRQWSDAITCAIEGLWTVQYPLDGAVVTVKDDEVKLFKDGFLAAFQEANQEPKELLPVSKVFAHQSEGSSDMALGELMNVANELRSVEERLGKKVRWLAWRDILSATQDVRTQEEIRESLLGELNKNGLLTQDAATFLRERILKDPELELADEELEDGTDTNYVLQNIEVVEQAIGQLQTKKIFHSSKASLARILANLGMSARARDLIHEAMEGFEQSIGAQKMSGGDTRAWAKNVRGFFSSSSKTSRPERWHVWVALNTWLVFKHIEPSKADDAQAAYEHLFEQLQSFEKDDMRRTAESLEARVGQKNVAEFLAIDSRSFFSSKPLPSSMQKITQGLERARQLQGDPKEKVDVSDLVQRGVDMAMNEMTQSAHPSLEIVARLILEMVENLRRMKWDKEKRPVEIFEVFVKDLPTRPLSEQASRLYFAVLHCVAARALMDLGREKDAMERLSDIVDWVGLEYMQVLDFVDLVKKEVLLAIELSPRNQRVEALRHLMKSLLMQEKHEIGDDPKKPGAGFEIAYQAYEVIQMIDHTLEAAISNEKLALRRLRDFEEREEARIRYWVQRDQPALG